ncbi:MAG: GNAT family N-acetyltransferase [Chloroflexi bacterium]|nr:GNAT family N-acetyltransferase [Chloroflexota bacterium]
MNSSVLPSRATARLVLRPFTMADAEVLCEIVNEPDIFQYFPSKATWLLEKCERYINYQTRHWENLGYGHWAVTLAETGQLIGWCGLEFLPDTKETEVGYLLSKPFWGRGYATEAANASVQFGKKDIRLQEIIGLTDPLNVASQKVLEKNGLVFTRKQIYFGMEMFRFATQA